MNTWHQKTIHMIIKYNTARRRKSMSTSFVNIASFSKVTINFYPYSISEHIKWICNPGFPWSPITTWTFIKLEPLGMQEFWFGPSKARLGTKVTICLGNVEWQGIVWGANDKFYIVCVKCNLGSLDAIEAYLSSSNKN